MHPPELVREKKCIYIYIYIYIYICKNIHAYHRIYMDIYGYPMISVVLMDNP